MEIEPVAKEPVPMDSIHLSPRELYLLVAALEKTLTLRLNMSDKAMELQAKEYERRLEVLNNDRQEARNKEGSFLGRVEYDSQHGELTKKVDLNASQLIALNQVSARVEAIYVWRDEMSKSVAALQSRIASLVAYGAGFGLALTVAMFVINKIWK